MTFGEKTITWADVMKIHKTQTAVQFQGQKIASIICSPEQNKLVNEQQIIYTIPNKKQYLKLISEMKLYIADNSPVNFFIKKDKNVWTDAGFYKLNSCFESDASTDFLFEKY
jgi:hypothetical protein